LYFYYSTIRLSSCDIVFVLQYNTFEQLWYCNFTTVQYVWAAVVLYCYCSTLRLSSCGIVFFITVQFFRAAVVLYLYYSTIRSSSCVLTTQTSDCSNSSTITCSYWSRRSTRRKASNGNSSTLAWTWNRPLISLKRFFYAPMTEQKSNNVKSDNLQRQKIQHNWIYQIRHIKIYWIQHN